MGNKMLEKVSKATAAIGAVAVGLMVFEAASSASSAAEDDVRTVAKNIKKKISPEPPVKKHFWSKTKKEV